LVPQFQGGNIVNEFVTWEMARMRRAEHMQDADNFRRAKAARPERSARRMPFFSKFRARTSEV
jgi:hypothetical protein